MLKYNFKKFFKEHSLHDDNWFANGHFMLNKSILTAAQKRVFDDENKTEETISNFLQLVENARKFYDNTKEHQQFVPELVSYYDDKYTSNIFHNNSIDLSIREEYYNFLTSRKCKLYKGERDINPVAVIDKDNEFVGFLLPVRVDKNEIVSGIDYDDYIKQLEDEKKAKAERKKVS